MINKDIKKSHKLATKLIRGGTKRSNFGETSEAIFLNSGFCYDSADVAKARFNGEQPGFVYSRYSNPTLTMLEERLALIEDAEKAIVTSSGMSAVFASIMATIKTGEHLLANKVLFGSCYYIITQILPRFGIEYTLVDGKDNEAWEKAFKKNTTHIFIETPANPTLEMVDIEHVGRLSKKHNCIFIVDNIFATPLLQKPLLLGADIVVYSTTKHMDGGGKTLGGAILGGEKHLTEKILPFVRHTGPALSPFNAWVVLKSLESFDLRMEKHCTNAEKLAEFLGNHKKVEKIYYPHHKSFPQYKLAKKQMLRGSNMIAFAVKAKNEAEVFAFLNRLKLIDISNNLGDSKSLITHPATTTHSNIEKSEREKMGITDNLLRLSVGLEDADDLIDDLKLAL
ncbi:MAG: trans-sulfuration enzyme family protein [Alphaproteobacteria bacterium]|jgi:O-succinylhomoserine sulfhydrylase